MEYIDPAGGEQEVRRESSSIFPKIGSRAQGSRTISGTAYHAVKNLEDLNSGR
jgi:hypothetical protein